MKKSMMIAITAGLIGFNSASAATCFRYPASDAANRNTMCNAQPENRFDCRNDQQPGECPAGPYTTIKKGRATCDGMMNCRVPGMEESFDLNDHQSSRIKQLCQKQFALAATERQKLTRLYHDLRRESLKSHPDRKIIGQLAESIGNQHTALARLESTHMEEIGSILTPSQREMMQNMAADRPAGSYCGMICQ